MFVYNSFSAKFQNLNIESLYVVPKYTLKISFLKILVYLKFMRELLNMIKILNTQLLNNL